MKHYGDVSNINGAEVEPVPIAVTKSRFEGEQNGKKNRKTRQREH